MKAADTIVRRVLDAQPTRLDEQVALVLFALTFVAAGAVIAAGKALWPR